MTNNPTDDLPVSDAYLSAYAEVVATHSLKVQAGQRVVCFVQSVDAMPLVRALARSVAQGGGLLLPILDTPDLVIASIEHRPEELLSISHLDNVFAWADAIVVAETHDGAEHWDRVNPQRLQQYGDANRAVWRAFHQRFPPGYSPTVFCVLPTPALASEASMSFEEYVQVFYQASLIDWASLTDSAYRIKARFDAGEEVRLVAPGTDLRLSLRGRTGTVENGIKSLPGGEVFYPPVETATEGYITFEWPQTYKGCEITGLRLRFESGRVVHAEADGGEECFHDILNTDDGARLLGEFGIGCNYGISQYTKSLFFDEKMGGTIHLALGFAYKLGGGQNESAIHFDLVKDLRENGQIWLDGVKVFESGTFLF